MDADRIAAVLGFCAFWAAFLTVVLVIKTIS